MVQILNAMLDEVSDEMPDRQVYECKGGRKVLHVGHYERIITAGAGTMTVSVPKLKGKLLFRP